MFEKDLIKKLRHLREKSQRKTLFKRLIKNVFFRLSN